MSDKAHGPVNQRLSRRNHRVQAALGLARRGLYVHPCRPYTKLPALNHWPAQASNNPDEIRRWWRWWRRANVAVMCGGQARLLVIDVDPAKGGKASLSDVEGAHKIPTTVAVITPSGGLHLWLRVPDDRPLPGNTVGRLGPGLDTRGEHGYVLCPPSTVIQALPDGSGRIGFYRWSRACGDHIAEAPAWLLDRLDRAAGNGHATPPEEWLELASAGVGEGERNASVARLSGKLFRHLPAADAVLVAELVACWNQVRCRPPLEADELWRTLDSIAAAELRRRGLDQ